MCSDRCKMSIYHFRHIQKTSLPHLATSGAHVLLGSTTGLVRECFHLAFCKLAITACLIPRMNRTNAQLPRTAHPQAKVVMPGAFHEQGFPFIPLVSVLLTLLEHSWISTISPVFPVVSFLHPAILVLSLLQNIFSFHIRGIPNHQHERDNGGTYWLDYGRETCGNGVSHLTSTRVFSLKLPDTDSLLAPYWPRTYQYRPSRSRPHARQISARYSRDSSNPKPIFH